MSNQETFLWFLVAYSIVAGWALWTAKRDRKEEE